MKAKRRGRGSGGRGRGAAPHSAADVSRSIVAASRRQTALLAGLVLLFASVLYASTLWGGFVLDDASMVALNPLVHTLRRVPELFVSDYWQPIAKGGLYRPITTLSYALNFFVSSDRPALYHAVNVLLHALNSALVLFVCLRLTGDRIVAFAAALLFAAHAIHTEAVDGIVGRAELLSTFFFLSSFHLYLRSEDSGGRYPTAAYLGSLVTFALSLLSKENGITLLGVILCHDVILGSENAGNNGLLERARRVLVARWRSVYLGYALVALGYLALRHLVLTNGALIAPTAMVDNPLIALKPGWRVLNALQVVLRYLGLLVFPLHLSYDYSYRQIFMLDSLRDPRSLAVLGASVALVVASAIVYVRSRMTFFALSFLIVTFSIVSNLVIPIGTAMGERLLYLPSVGFCLLVALALRALAHALPLSPSRARASLWIALTVLVALHGARTVVRNRDWLSEERLFLHDLAISPTSAKVQHNAGTILVAQGDVEAGLEHLRKAIEIDPDHGGAYAAIGHALLQLGREQEAIDAYEAAIRLPLKDASPLNNLGFLLVERGIDLPRGVELLKAAVQLEPDNPHILDSLGLAYFKTGRAREARALIKRSLELDDTADSARARRAHLAEIEAALAPPKSLGSAELPRSP